MSTEGTPILMNPPNSSSAVDESEGITNEHREQTGAFETEGTTSHGNETLQTQEEEQQESFHKNKRKKTSHVWSDFEVVMLNGIKKARCTHCSSHFTYSKSGLTTTYKRHKDRCVQSKLSLRVIEKQKRLNLLPSDEAFPSLPPLHPGKFDMEQMRESAAQ